MAGIPIITIGYMNHLEAINRPKITSSRDAEKLFRPYFEMQGIETYEYMFGLFMGRDNKARGIALIGMGSATATIASTQKVAQMALLSHASAVILCHNHPSGNTDPSKQDISLSKTMEQTLKLVECSLLDSLIITRESYLSLKDEGHF